MALGERKVRVYQKTQFDGRPWYRLIWRGRVCENLLFGTVVASYLVDLPGHRRGKFSEKRTKRLPS
jgi:hypothetical protein